MFNLGRITLEKCKKYKLKKEKEDEMAELDVSKIITTSGIQCLNYNLFNKSMIRLILFFFSER